MASKKSAKAQAGQHSGDTSGAAPSLIICRNKHWRYISSFHGPWLQLPPEILASLAHQNYTMPQPRLIDPAVFYDIVKIRRAVDEATEDAVRASSGLSSTAMNSPLGRLDPFGGGGGGGVGAGPKMSKERIYKIRQKAVKALAKAYTLDEVAASVATMQSTSSLEDVAMHVLKRDKTDHDAKYVHFFHEKIPSRMMEHYTPLDPLTDSILTLPWEAQAAPLRTRGLVQIFKADYEAAANDFTLALRIATELKSRHKPGTDQLVLAKHFKEQQDSWNRSGRDWRSVPQLKEEDQPSSLAHQMLFNRAGVYLTIACQHVHEALNGLAEQQASAHAQSNGAANGDAPGMSTEQKQAHQVRLDARKKVKTNAKRALRDYLAFLEHFDYTPGLPFEVTNEIMRRVYDVASGNKAQMSASRYRLTDLNGDNSISSGSGSSDALVLSQKPKPTAESKLQWDADDWPRFSRPQIHPASALFAATPPPGLPDCPSSSHSSHAAHQSVPDPLSLGTREAITYHPLLTDALHSLLLSHALLQTSPTELLRHAHNAARLARIADGYPVFQSARSPARADWIEVLRRANNWIGLAQPWQKLCQPAPLPTAAGGGFKNGHASEAPSSSPSCHGTGTGHSRGARAAQQDGVVGGQELVAQRTNGHGPAAVVETEEQKRERRKQEAILDALADERVVDEESFQRAVRAREQRAIDDEEGLSGPLNDRILAADSGIGDVGAGAGNDVSGAAGVGGGGGGNGAKAAEAKAPKRWAQDDADKEYPISTDRAEAVARWVREAPLSMGGAKKKRPVRKKAAAGTASSAGVVGTGNGVEGLCLGEDGDEDKGGEEVD